MQLYVCVCVFVWGLGFRSDVYFGFLPSICAAFHQEHKNEKEKNNKMKEKKRCKQLLIILKQLEKKNKRKQTAAEISCNMAVTQQAARPRF